MPRAMLQEVMKQPVENNSTTKGKTFDYPVIFAKAPRYLESQVKSAHKRYDSDGSELSDADSNLENEAPVLLPPKPIDISRFLPPIGVFWDIENCQIPRRKSAVAIAQAIRDRFFQGYREVEFVVVCDVTKENSKIIEELNYAQVNLIHVSATSKNAADEKLRQSIRRFADIHLAPAAVILISSDINFAGDLNDLRHRRKIHVILIHNDKISDALILCANEHYYFSDIVDTTICRQNLREPILNVEILVSNLPVKKDSNKIKHRLKQLSNNLGGRISFISETVCSIRFPTWEFALRLSRVSFRILNFFVSDITPHEALDFSKPFANE